MAKIKCRHVKTLYPGNGTGGIMIAEYQAYDGENLHESLHGRLFKAKGHELPTSGAFTLEGSWTYDAKYQNYYLKTRSAEPYVAPNKAAIIEYLSTIPEVGVDNAEKIFNVFGLKTIDSIQENPALLCKVRNIGADQLKKIIQHFHSARIIHELTALLTDYELSKQDIRNIYEEFQENAIQTIKDNPFHLTKVRGVSYRTIDSTARRNKIALDSTPRVESAVICALEDDGRNGHVFSEPAKLASAVFKLLNDGLPNSISMNRIMDTVNRMVSQKRITYKRGIYLNERYQAEDTSAQIIYRMLSCRPTDIYPRNELDHLIKKSCDSYRIELADMQKQALKTSLTSNISIITGGPGTGKTTVLNIFVDCLLRTGLKAEQFALCAPTGRAARRMKEATGAAACTVHKLLGLGEEGAGINCRELPQELQFVIIDEASMIDMDMLYHVLSALGQKTRLILVGDMDQLPSVGPGNVLRELITSGKIPVTKLDVVYRQAANSLITVNSPKIASGQTDLKFGDSFVFLQTVNAEDTTRQILQQYQSAVSEMGADEVQILCPVWKNDYGPGVLTLNHDIQNLVNPSRGELEYNSKTRCFRVGDRVMQLKNDDFTGVNNGDIGIIRDIHHHPDKRRQVQIAVEFEGQPGEDIMYDSDNLDEITLSYAITIHKSQGTEFGTVIVPMLGCYKNMLVRNLLYTAVTRGKQRVILVGSWEAIEKAIKTTNCSCRNTHLSERLNFFFAQEMHTAA